MTRHEITRHRHELHRRTLTVVRTIPVTPSMRRVVLTGAELAGFSSLSPDDHVKVGVSGPDGTVERRDYTPRRFDPARNELWIDFALHGEADEAGPATAWARAAAPGDTLLVGGPKGSAVIPADFDWWLLIGDETALPAIGRRVEELPPGVPVTTLVAVAGPAEEQRFEAAATHRPLWVHRPPSAAADPAPLLAALRGLVLPPGEGFVWIAAEAAVARALRAHVATALGHPPAWTKASGYWVHGQADSSEK